MGSNSQAAQTDLERATVALQHRAERYQEQHRFASVRGVMAWYLRARMGAASVPTAAPRTTRYHTGFDRLGRSQWGDARVSVDSSGGEGRDSTMALLFTIHAIVRVVADSGDGRWRAYSLVHVDGDSDGAGCPKRETKRKGRVLLTQQEAGVKMGMSQASVSRAIGWVESQMREPLKAAGVLV